jgi:hypothetical protein
MEELSEAVVTLTAVEEGKSGFERQFEVKGTPFYYC